MSIDNAWKVIFEKSIDISKDINYITANDIKKLTGKEPRLMAKFDTYESQPEIFKKHGFFILPVSRKEYALVKGVGFKNVEKIDSKPIELTSRVAENLASLDYSSGEAKYLAIALNAGLFEKFLEMPTLVFASMQSRKVTPEFSFSVEKVGPLKVKSAQMEIDMLLENPSNVVLIEAKIGDVENFNIRQLYYPYRSYSNFVPVKNSINIFFTYNDHGEIYSFWKYRFKDDNQYNSIELEKKGSFNLESDLEESLTLEEVSEKEEADDYVIKEWEIPQADKIHKVAQFPFLVAKGLNTSILISEYLKFTPRQSSYYRHATESLGLVKLDREKNTYFLTKLGEKYVVLPIAERNALLSSLLFKLSIMEKVVQTILQSPKQQITQEEIAEIIRRNTRYTGTTPPRRAQTIFKWFEWIQETLGIVEVKDRTIRIPRFQTKQTKFF